LGEGAPRKFEADFVISTMPINELIASIRGIEVPKNVAEVASALPFRDFMTVGLLLNRLDIEDPSGKQIQDNWIYIQEPHVKVGRLQIFNNWSPHLVADPDKVWIGMEYFVQEGDELWTMSDSDMIAFGVEELQSIGMVRREDVVDATVIRVKKTYPAYFGSYARFDEVRDFVDGIGNLFLVGRNGMHRYNNQDHSMLTAMAAVQNIVSGIADKSNIWDINVDQDYHEEKSN
jgi:protoporphyrinogen oxidase